jgi:hypothetical protein
LRAASDEKMNSILMRGIVDRNNTGRLAIVAARSDVENVNID